MNSECKPIETCYNGYRFRSRLEARWAVFFDAAGIKYWYEPDGFSWESTNDVGEHVTKRYLPDFWLPQFNSFAEIKPTYERLMKDRNKLGEALDWNKTPVSKGLLILGQIPFYKGLNIPFFLQFYCNKGVRTRWVCFDTELLSTHDNTISIANDDIPDIEKIDFVEKESFELFQDTLYRLDLIPEKWDGHLYKMSQYDVARISNYYRPCFLKARQARFEHGETS